MRCYRSRERLQARRQMAYRMLPLLLLLATFFVVGLEHAMADNEPVYDQFTLQATAESTVENDLMTVRLRIEHEDSNTAALADRVNLDMQWALDQLKETEALQYRTENYTSYPKYEQQRIVGWRSSQGLMISGAVTGDDFETLKKVIQTLQQRLQVVEMSFRPSEDTRTEVEDSLINEALNNFKRRAEIVQANMQASAYRIMQINIHTPAGQGEHSRMRGDMMAMQSRAVEQGPAVEAGETRISVSVSGQIQLQ